MKVSVTERRLPSGKLSFYLDFTLNGKRIREKLDLISVFKSSKEYKEQKKLAETIAKKRSLEIIEGKYQIPTTKKTNTLLSFFNEYVNNYKKKDKRKANAVREKLNAYLTRDILLENVDEAFAEGFRDYLRFDLSAEATRNYFGLFKRAIDEAVKMKLIRVNLIKGVTVNMSGISDSKLSKEILDIDELKALATTDCSNKMVKKAFLFSCNTGITYSEIRVLKFKDVKGGVLKYKRHKTKNQVEVNVPLNANAQRIIDSMSNEGEQDLVFPELPTTSNGVNKVLKGWMKKADIDKHITYYCSRHTFGTLQAEKGTNQSVIAKNMGHTSTRHTDKYINHVDKAKEAAVQFDSF